MEEKTKNELYRILGLLDIQIEMIEAWLSGKQVLAPRRCGVTTAKQAKELLDFIEQELDRAREEGEEAERDRIFRGLDSIDCIEEALPKNYSASGMQLGIYRAKEIVLEKELSKLTNK